MSERSAPDAEVLSRAAATDAPADAAVGTEDGRTARGRRTAGRLLLAAREVFAAQSYTQARVEDITEAAGVSHGTFYTYFTNRAAVLDALVDEATARLHTVVERPWEGDDLIATVRSVISDSVEVLAAEADVIAAWYDAAATDPHFRARWMTLRQGFSDRVAVHLAPVLLGSAHDPAVASSALVAMVEGYATDPFTASGSGAHESAVLTLATIWVGGLREMSHIRE